MALLVFTSAHDQGNVSHHWHPRLIITVTSPIVIIFAVIGLLSVVLAGGDVQKIDLLSVINRLLSSSSMHRVLVQSWCCNLLPLYTFPLKQCG